MSSEVTRDARAREDAPESVAGALLASLGRGDARARVAQTARAMLTWCQVNGDVERAHTTGVSVERPRASARDPRLVVYVDSQAFVTDFTANREVYLARLDAAGLRFSEVSFARSRAAAPARAERPGSAARAAAPDLPPLPATEERRVAELCSKLPESLRATVSQAMRTSLRSQLEQTS